MTQSAKSGKAGLGVEAVIGDVRLLHNRAWDEHRLKPESAISLTTRASRLIIESFGDPGGPGQFSDAAEAGAVSQYRPCDLRAENYAIRAACAALVQEQGISLVLEPAEILIAEAEAALTDSAEPLIRARVAYVKSAILRNGFDYEGAEAMLRFVLSLVTSDESLVDAETTAMFQLRIDALNNIGRLQIFRGEFPKALETELSVLELLRQEPIASKGGYSYGEASALKNLAIVHQRLGSFAAAVDAGYRSLALNQEREDHFDTASCLISLANISMAINEPAGALDHLNSALELSRTHGSAVAEAIVLGNIGYVLHFRGELDSAIEHYRTAAAIQEKTNYLRGAAVNLSNLGDALGEQGYLEDACNSLERALQIHRKLGDQHGIATCLISLGRVSAQSTSDTPGHSEFDMPPFQAFLNEALDVIALTGSEDLLVAAHEAFAEAYRRRGDYAEALHHFRLFHEHKLRMVEAHAADRTQALLVRQELDQSRKDSEVQRRHARELQAALDEAREQRTLAQRLANEDALTGLPNRRHGDELLARALDEAQQSGKPISLVFADADHFKSINDRYLHLTGDLVLRHLADICKVHCGVTDVVVRYGGEEFLFLLTSTDLGAARQWAERLRIHVERYDWNTVHPDISVTLSLGIATWSPDDGPALRARLLSSADARLYEAKKAGRNCVRP